MKKFKKSIAVLALTLTVVSSTVAASALCHCRCHTAPPTELVECWCMGHCGE